MVYETPEQSMQSAQRSLTTQRAGGTYRPGTGGSIGKGSAEIKLQRWIRRGVTLGVAVVGILLATGIAGFVLNGIGFWGVIMTVLALAAAVSAFAFWPSPKPPKRSELKQGDPKKMVARTELWLEAQRPALPAPAVQVVDQLGVQLDALGLQLATVDAEHPAMGEVRELVGEYIPETIDNYRKVPEHLRKEKHTGKTADERLTDSLGKLSGEIDRVTRRLAEGALDDLAIKDRYLGYRYGGDELIEDMQTPAKSED